MLADPQSQIITDGILNDSIAKDDCTTGWPNPGTIGLAPIGIVQSKYFRKRLYATYASPTILSSGVGSIRALGRRVVNTDLSELKSFSTSDVVRPGPRLTLVLDVDLKPEDACVRRGRSITSHFQSRTWDHSSLLQRAARPSIRLRNSQSARDHDFTNRFPVYQGAFRICGRHSAKGEIL